MAPGHYQPVSDALGQTVPGLNYCGRIQTPLLRRIRLLPVEFASQQQQKRKLVLSSKRQPIEQPVAQTSSSSSKQKAAAGAAALLAAGAIAYFAQGHSVKDATQAVERTATAAGSAGPLIFIGSYAIATVILVPASALTLAAGFLYGPIKGTAIVSAASTLGATLAFLVSRYLARPFVLHKLQDYPKLAAVQSKVSADGANVVFLLRLSPLVPFTLLNYALGVTEVPLASYIGTSWAGMLPATIAYVYLGSTGRSATDAGSGSFDTVKFGLYAVGAVATLLLTKLVADRASAALEDEDLKNS
ncbi:hypothetical protein ABBQ32_009982 [Trebouxia sp. C0010 RCD-2024]